MIIPAWLEDEEEPFPPLLREGERGFELHGLRQPIKIPRNPFFKEGRPGPV